jgi:methionyl-tRNA synthetase
MRKFYITTAIDYVNNLPHLGTAYEKICADVIARFKRIQGFDVYFLMGNDEHSINVKKKAQEEGLSPIEYCNQMEERFKDVWRRLDISFDHFIRTTSLSHKKVVQHVFKKINSRGEIYRGVYKGWYCDSCEAYIKDADLKGGLCPNHGQKPCWLEEENLFFRLSNYRERILKLIEQNPEFIRPRVRRNEIINILQEGLEDISITRKGIGWGVDTPGEEGQTIYVWFDALLNYISGAGFLQEQEKFSRYWPADLHLVGKDITRFHAIIWPAMLFSCGIDPPKSIFGHGFVYVKGQKLSKTLGTLIDPLQIQEKFGADSLRYFLLRDISFGEDGDFSWEKFLRRYNAELANDLGNLLHRTLNMVNRYLEGVVSSSGESAPLDDRLKGEFLSSVGRITSLMEDLELHIALSEIWKLVNLLNTYLENASPWSLAKSQQKERLKGVLYTALEGLRILSILVFPFIPSSARRIWDQLGLSGEEFRAIKLDHANKWGYIKLGTKVKKGVPIFPRLKEDG